MIWCLMFFFFFLREFDLTLKNLKKKEKRKKEKRIAWLEFYHDLILKGEKRRGWSFIIWPLLSQFLY